MSNNSFNFNKFEVVTVDTTLESGKTYITDSSNKLILTLPSTCIVGAFIKVVGKGSGGWEIRQNSGQTISFSGTITITGVNGGIVSVTSKSSVTLKCITANTDFEVVASNNFEQFNYFSIGRVAGYSVGGFTGSYVNTINKLNYSTETRTTPSAVLTQNIAFIQSGISDSKKGYRMGGNPLTNVIDRLLFSDDTVTALSATLNTSRDSTAGVAGEFKGYVFGGQAPGASNGIEDLNLITETSDTISTTLPANRIAMGTIAFTEFAYLAGGNSTGVADGSTATNTIYKFNMNSSTITTISNVLNISRAYSSSGNTNNFGYFFNAISPTNVYSTNVDKFNRSTETLTSLTSLWVAGGQQAANLNGFRRAYSVAGLNSSAAFINSIKYLQMDSTETSGTLSATIATATQSPGGI